MQRFAVLFGLLFVSTLWSDEREYAIFDIRNDLVYIEAKLTKDAIGVTGKVYKSGVELPDDGSGKKRYTKLVIGSATVAEVEADYAALRAPQEMILQIAKGDIVRLEIAAARQLEIDPKNPEVPARLNQLFIAGSGVTGDTKFYLGELGYRRFFEGNTKVLNVTPESMAIELRPLQTTATGFDRTAFALFYKVTFFSDKWLFFNTGLQFGLDKTSASGGLLIGIGVLYNDAIRFEGNIEFLSRTYADYHGKLTIMPKNMVSFIIQSGVLSLYTQQPYTYYNYSYYSTTYSSTSTYYSTYYVDLTYFTVGLGIRTDRLMLTGRGGLAGTNLNNLGFIARAEIAFLF